MSSISSKNRKRVTIVRHGERVDLVFGKKTWMDLCFNSKGEYTQKDLNMPKTILKRENYQDYEKDSPLTRIGVYQATLTGENLAENNIDYSLVICSPSLRCLQTCDALLKASKKSFLPIAIEPGFHDKMNQEKWLTEQELVSAGFYIKTDYKPYISKETLYSRTNETLSDYFERNGFVLNEILKKANKEGINILIVAHAGTLTIPHWMKTKHRIPIMEDTVILNTYLEYSAVIIMDQKEKKKTDVADEIVNWEEYQSNTLLNLKHDKREHFFYNAYKEKALEIYKNDLI